MTLESPADVSTVFLGEFEQQEPLWMKSDRELKRRAKLMRYEKMWDAVDPGRKFLPRAGEFDRLIDVACSVTGITRTQIFARYRGAAVSLPRQAVFVLCRKYWPHYTTLGIGRKFGMDHTTVIYAWRKYDNADRKEIRQLPEQTKIKFRSLVDEIDRVFQRVKK